MNEIDILKSIAENLSQRNASAALNNYEVLCNNIKYVNNLLDYGVESLKETHSKMEIAYNNDNFVAEDFKDNSKEGYYFRTIIPRIVLNDINVIRKFIYYTQPDNRIGITVETVGKLKKDFLDFNNLLTSARQFIDSLVSDAYQLILLDPKEINFHVLTSLNSFNKYATKSIREALFNSNIQNSLAEFENLDYNKRVRGQVSTITKCDKKTFGEKVEFLFSNLGLITDNDFKEEIKNLFSFSSEFTHIGYVSTFFTSSTPKEVIFADDIGPYLPSTENFSELKYEVLETATKFFAKVYVPAVKNALKKSLEQDSFENFENDIDETNTNIMRGLGTRNNQYYFFITKNHVESQKIINLKCNCGTINYWKPPHDSSALYCKNCGSKFELIVMEGDPGYIITSNGPVKVIGSSVPDFNELSVEEQNNLIKKCEEVINKNNGV